MSDQQSVLGGVGGVNSVLEAGDKIQGLVDQIKGDLEAKAGKSFPQFKAISYKSQVVAGTNYFVKIQVDDNEYVHVRIFESLPHAGKNVELHSHQPGKSKDDQLEYF